MPAPAAIAAALAAARIAARAIGAVARRLRRSANEKETKRGREESDPHKRLEEIEAQRAALRKELAEKTLEAAGDVARTVGRASGARRALEELGREKPAEEERRSDDDHRLSEAEHRTRYKILRDDHFEKAEPAEAGEQPVAIIVMGQPGSGKMTVGDSAVHMLTQEGRVPVRIDTDDLRPYHKSYRRLSAEDAARDPLGLGLESNAASAVQPDAGRWRAMLLDDTIASRRHMVYETTGESPRGVSQLTTKLADAGYRVDIKALATTHERSLQGTKLRYAQRKVDETMARYMPEAVHDKGYKGLPRTLDRLQRDGRVNSIAILRDRDHKPIAEFEYGRDAAKGNERRKTPGEELRSERARDRTAEERRIYDDGQETLKEARETLRERGRTNERGRNREGEGGEVKRRGKPTMTAPDVTKKQTHTHTRAKAEDDWTRERSR